MDEQTFKRLLKEELRSLKDIVEVTKKKVENQELNIHVTAGNVRTVRDQQSVMNEKLDAHSASLVDIESKIDAFADAYKQNQRNIEKLTKRTETVEDELDINPPEEYKVGYSSSELLPPPTR